MRLTTGEQLRELMDILPRYETTAENCDMFRERVAELEHRCGMYGLELTNEVERRLQAERQLSAIKAQEPVIDAPYGGILRIEAGNLPDSLVRINPCKLYAAPVSEAKAQGVVMPERWNVPRPMWKDARQPYGNPLNHADIEAAEKFNLALDEVARLNAAPVQQDQAFCEYCGGNDEEPQDHCMDCTRPVQQVSVPDGFERYRLANKFCEQRLVTDDHVRAIVVDAFASGYGFGISAAPAAPAADAGLVEALERTEKLAEMQLGMIAARAAGNYLDKTPVVRAFQRYRKIATDALAAHRAAPAQPQSDAVMVPVELVTATNALLHQIDIGDFVDSNGHSAKMLKPVHDLMSLLAAALKASLKTQLDQCTECAEVYAERDMLKAKDAVQVDYVAVMRDDGDGGVEPEWMMEGGTAELQEGVYLCCLDGGMLMFDGGSGQIYVSKGDQK